MWAADSSWLVALVNGDDSHHAAARREATQAGAVLVNPAILMRFLETIRSEIGRRESHMALDALLRTPTMRMTPQPSVAAVARVMGHHAGLSWHDASAICTALDEGAGLRTFDREQRKAFEALS